MKTPSNLQYIVIDLREFYPFVKQELMANSFLSPRVITEQDADVLTEPVIATLFYLKNNLEVMNGIGRMSHLFYYYRLDEFVEIFDNLQLSFASFLECNGITRANMYHVYRPDTFRTVFVKHEKILYV